MKYANDARNGLGFGKRAEMKSSHQESTEEIKRLRRCINDLVSVIALPASWTGGEANHIVQILIKTLLRLLSLDFVYARLNEMKEEPNEFIQLADSLEPAFEPQEICQIIKPWLGNSPQTGPLFTKKPVGNGSFSIVSLPIGLQGEFGLIVAGSQRPDFPAQAEKVVLDVAVNQAVIGLQEARLLKEQKRVAIELDERVTQRTLELARVNEALEKQIVERWQAEESLRESERMSSLIVDSIPGLVALLTATGEVEVVNRQLLDYFGQRLEELKQWGTNGTVHPDDLPHVIEVFTRSITSGIPYEIVQRLRRGDGSYRWIQNSGFPLRDKNGQITRWCVLLTDIDERKRAEEALQHSERDLKLIIDTIPALVWSAYPDGNADFFSQHYLDYVGLSTEQVEGWGWTKAVHPEDLFGLAAMWERIMASEKIGEAEARLRRHDGEYRWFLFRVNPLRDETGKIVKWYGQNTDIEDRKRSEFLLRESEMQFKTIFDEAGTGITLVDLTVGEPVRNNRALREMLNCSEEELSRFETYNQLTHEDERERDALTFRELCEGKRDSLRIEKHFVLKDGRSIWANVIFTLLRDEDGQPQYVITIHEDITERKLALEKLQANQDLLDLAQKSASAMAFDWHINQEINVWSPEHESLYGLTPGTFDGSYQAWKKMIYPPDWASVLEAIKHAHETGKVATEFRVIWKDGTTHWLATNGRMFFDEMGKPLRIVGFTTDITKRKLIEENLRRSEAFLAEGQHLARMGNFTWRVETEEIMWSEQLYRIFEFKAGITITIEMIASRVHPEDMPLLYDMVERARRRMRDFAYEHRLLMPDGSIKYLHLIAHKIQDQKGQLEYIGAVQDVTKRRLSEEALSKARSELARVSRIMSLGVLTASIAHEVNQPLSGIITNASTCLRMLDADPPNIEGARETVRRTIRDGNRASDVIKRLRSLFSKKDFTVELVDLNEAATEVIALSQSELQRSQTVFRAELAKDLPMIAGDRVQIQQVILNLLLNSLDAMSVVDNRSKELIIKTELDEDDRVRLSVRDTGIGLAPDEVGKIFDAFYTTKKSGMGIGLSVSRSIIEKHQGQLWAESNKGPGAVFCFSIPIQDESGDVHRTDLSFDDVNNKKILRKI